MYKIEPFQLKQDDREEEKCDMKFRFERVTTREGGKYRIEIRNQIYGEISYVHACREKKADAHIAIDIGRYPRPIETHAYQKPKREKIFRKLKNVKASLGISSD